MQSETPQSTLIIVQISNSLTSSDMAQSSSQECVGGRLNIHMCLCVPVLTGKGQKTQQKAAKYPGVKLTYYFAFKSLSLLFQSTWMPPKSMQILHLKNCFTQVRCWISRTELLFSENNFSSLQCLCFALQSVLADGRGCFSCTGSPAHIWRPLSLLHSQVASGDQFTKQR